MDEREQEKVQNDEQESQGSLRDEGDQDTEGQGAKFSGRDSEDDKSEGGDTEGHRFGYSDVRLKSAVRPVHGLGSPTSL